LAGILAFSTSVAAFLRSVAVFLRKLSAVILSWCSVDATGLWQLLCGAFDAPAHAWSDDHHNVVGFHHLLEGHDLHVMRALDAVV
jgi:hypothetical protein